MLDLKGMEREGDTGMLSYNLPLNPSFRAHFTLLYLKLPYHCLLTALFQSLAIGVFTNSLEVVVIPNIIWTLLSLLITTQAGFSKEIYIKVKSLMFHLFSGFKILLILFCLKSVRVQ